MSFSNEISQSENLEIEFALQPVGGEAALENELAKPDQNEKRYGEKCALPAGLWLRAVMGFEAPFGHDGLPTVWG